jgi:hypothetical protein
MINQMVIPIESVPLSVNHDNNEMESGTILVPIQKDTY